MLDGLPVDEQDYSNSYDLIQALKSIAQEKIASGDAIGVSDTLSEQTLNEVYRGGRHERSYWMHVGGSS